MLTSEQTHQNVPLVINRDEETDRVQIGVDLDGVFVPFFETKLSLFDHFHNLGREQQAQQQQNKQNDQPQQPTQ